MQEKSELISEELEQQLRDIFGKLTKEVCVICITKEGQKESEEMKSLVNHVCSLSDKLFCKILTQEQAPEELSDIHYPLTALYLQDTFTGVVFHGVPGGQEMNSFVLGICTVGGANSKIDTMLIDKCKSITANHRIDILVSLSCHHCAKQVIAAQQIAALSEYVRADMYDARLYPDLVDKYKIERIPMTVIDGQKILLGVKSVEELCEEIM